MLKRFLPFILLTVAGLAHAGVTTQSITFHSQAMDATTTYIAVLPEPLAPDLEYPVLYLLHGAYGGYSDWTSNTRVVQEMEGRPFILITPDGGEFGWYVDSPHLKNHQYDTLISSELVANVESQFPTAKVRGKRGIAGLSMGGHGALSLAAKHPDVYGSASSLSGILHIQNHPKKWNIAKALGELADAPEQWSRNSVYSLAHHFASAQTALLFDCGASDSTGATLDNEQLHQHLMNLRIPHTYISRPGDHTWKYWGEFIKDHLDFHQRAFNAE